MSRTPKQKRAAAARRGAMVARLSSTPRRGTAAKRAGSVAGPRFTPTRSSKT